MRDIQAIIGDIQTFHFGASAEDRLSSLADELEEHPNAPMAIRAVLELFERYPDEEFGMPGALAHVIERFYGVGYDNELELSLQRQPTGLTVWLGNRIANAKDGNSERFVELLAHVAKRTDIAENICVEAQHFVDLHRR